MLDSTMAFSDVTDGLGAERARRAPSCGVPAIRALASCAARRAERCHRDAYGLSP
jgi:hypothetical protein